MGVTRRATGIKKQSKLRTINNITTIGTWNVRTLQPCGKIEELERELDKYRWHFLGLVVVRWKGTGEKVTDNDNMIWYNGSADKYQQGVAFIVNNKIVKSVINVEHISSRIIYI